MTEPYLWRSTGAERTNWRDHAACSRLDPGLFLPVSTKGASLTDIEAAKRVCQRCPVTAACLRWALGPALVYPADSHVGYRLAGTSHRREDGGMDERRRPCPRRHQSPGLRKLTKPDARLGCGSEG
jgi:Transcription factor WhiB